MKGMGGGMTQYDPNKRCPKCGCGVIETIYKPSTPAFARDRVERKCIRCGCVWDESPLDAEEE